MISRKLIILVFAVLMAKFCSTEPTKNKIDLDELSRDKNAVYGFLYPSAYCSTADDIYRIALDTKNKRIIITCLPINQTYPKPHNEKKRYFKYYVINEYADIQFCGWRDITYSLKSDDKISKTTINSGTDQDNPCDNFNINDFTDR